MAPPDVLILGARAGSWHSVRLRWALEGRGRSVARLGFDDCGFTVDGYGGHVRLGGLTSLPRLVVVRFIPAGSFEQVTLRLGLLHALDAMGVPVVNSARAIERCTDKSMTSFLLARTGLPTPPTWTVETAEAAAAIVARETAAGRRLVLKPLFGAQGKGLRLVDSGQDLPAPEEVGGVFYLQRFVGRMGQDQTGWNDYRVLVAGGEPIAAMRRHGTSWITNIHQGGRPERVPATGRLAELAVAAVGAVGADYAGVDLIEDADGALQILEVNSMPAWQGLQKVAAVDIAERLAACLTRRLVPTPRAG